MASINKPEGSCQCQMKQEGTLIRARLKTPRAAAVAGILSIYILIDNLRRPPHTAPSSQGQTNS
jgi:hypothetical protein